MLKGEQLRFKAGWGREGGRRGERAGWGRGVSGERRVREVEQLRRFLSFVIIDSNVR